MISKTNHGIELASPNLFTATIRNWAPKSIICNIRGPMKIIHYVHKYYLHCYLHNGKFRDWLSWIKRIFNKLSHSSVQTFSWLKTPMERQMTALKTLQADNCYIKKVPSCIYEKFYLTFFSLKYIKLYLASLLLKYNKTIISFLF